MSDQVQDWDALFEEAASSPEFRLERLYLRLSHVIAEAMRNQQMSRTDLASALGVSAPMVTKILSGRSNFTLKTLVGVADALDYEFDPVLKPKDYCIAVDYVFSEKVAERMRIVAERAKNITRSRAVGRGISLSTYRDIGWDFLICDSSDAEMARRSAA